MSLESKIEELGEKIDKLTALLAKGITATVTKTGNGGAADATDAGKGDEGDEGGKKKRGANKDKGDDAGKGSSTKADADAPSEEDIRTAFGEFMRVDDADDREKRKEFVKKLLAKYKVAKATELKPEDRADAIKAVKAEGKRLAKASEDDDGDLV